MPTNLLNTTVKFLVALLKHQAENLLGKDAAGILGDDVQEKIDDWLKSEKTEKDLLKAAQQAQIYLQDERNCPNKDLRYFFRDVGFGDLPTVQEALAELPQAMDASGVTDALLESFRGFLTLSASQQEEGAKLYTEALLRAAGTLEPFTLPIIQKVVQDNSRKLDSLGVGQAEIKALLEKLSSFILQHSSFQTPPSPTQKGDLPIGSYIPFPRNHNFTGRVDDLIKLRDALLNDGQSGVVVNQALTGMGGIGKTQLAVEFAYEYGHRFQGVHWLDLRDPQALDSQIALCGEKMGLPLWPPTLPEQVTASLREWQQNNPRLLILDNFEETKFANEVLARLRHSGLRLLITSRHADWNAALGLRRLPLDEFTSEESREFLRKYIPDTREKISELDKLAIHLGHLPLALELAVRYLDKHPRLTISAYLDQLDKALEHKSMQNWKPEQKSLTGHDLSLLQTFALSWEQVKDENAQKLFMACGYCAPNTPIPDSILEAALGEGSELFDECVMELSGLGLLKDGASIHPLMAQFARRLDTDYTVLSQFSQSLAKLANSTNHKEDRTGNYALFSPLQPHVRDAAGYTNNANLASSGELWNSLGYHVKNLADYAGAKAAHERAIIVWEACLGADHPQVAIGVNNLGGVLVALGDLAGAKTAFERALKIDEVTYGTDHPSVARDVNNLGYVLQAQGDLVGAKVAYKRALEIFEKQLGENHSFVATLVNNLGGVLKAQGDLAGAKAAFERALKIDEATYGVDHPSVARDVNNLGSALRALGDLAGAKTAFERALKIDEVTYGANHPDVAIDVNNLGNVLKALGDLAGAKAAYERALKIFEKFLPPNHPYIQAVRDNLESLNQ
ncbi:MAG: tetratricopeptide repeat protein [Chloroflexi bacterium]|nr:tetratricopeptide repeat protein [Chloroflexota bacterium]